MTETQKALWRDFFSQAGITKSNWRKHWKALGKPHNRAVTGKRG